MAILKARAKINLFFHITSKREDGYHLIDSLVVFAEDIYDLIEIKEGKNKSTIDGEFAHLLASENNNLIDKTLQISSPGKEYHYNLTKNIPIGAGLGGGSSDAAMVAKYLNNNISNEELLEIGADLPICYHAQSAFCSGIGEIIEPIDNFPIIYLVLVYPNKSLLTKDVFMLNKNINSPKIISSSFKDTNQLIESLNSLKNDLTDAATQLLPEIKSILYLIMAQEGCKLSRMSGSGSTCLGIFTDKAQAIKASKNIAALKPEYWVKYSIAK
jgi:4-diphosphocytidyl-2-C-methyl-D-erythritol kinase